MAIMRHILLKVILLEATVVLQKTNKIFATAECTLQCLSYIECVLLTRQTTFVQP